MVKVLEEGAGTGNGPFSSGAGWEIPAKEPQVSERRIIGEELFEHRDDGAFDRRARERELQYESQRRMAEREAVRQWYESRGIETRTDRKWEGVEVTGDGEGVEEIPQVRALGSRAVETVRYSGPRMSESRDESRMYESRVTDRSLESRVVGESGSMKPSEYVARLGRLPRTMTNSYSRDSYSRARSMSPSRVTGRAMETLYSSRISRDSHPSSYSARARSPGARYKSPERVYPGVFVPREHIPDYYNEPTIRYHHSPPPMHHHFGGAPWSEPQVIYHGEPFMGGFPGPMFHHHHEPPRIIHHDPIPFTERIGRSPFIEARRFDGPVPHFPPRVMTPSEYVSAWGGDPFQGGGRVIEGGFPMGGHPQMGMGGPAYPIIVDYEPIVTEGPPMHYSAGMSDYPSQHQASSDPLAATNLIGKTDTSSADGFSMTYTSNDYFDKSSVEGDSAKDTSDYTGTLI